jgi:hypothetical protein
MEKKKTLRTLAEIQKRIPLIVAEVNANPQLALAAAANPLFALEELGYGIAPEVRAEVEDTVRFGPETAQQLQELRSQIFQAAGRTFDLQSEEELRQVLGEELKLPLPAAGKESATPAASGKLVLLPQLRWSEKTPDPLEGLRVAHPVMAPLLEYRRLEAGEPRLASRAVYDGVRQGKQSTPIGSISFVLKSQTQ